jgi:hypothetical protein
MDTSPSILSFCSGDYAFGRENKRDGSKNRWKRNGRKSLVTNLEMLLCMIIEPRKCHNASALVRSGGFAMVERAKKSLSKKGYQTSFVERDTGSVLWGENYIHACSDWQDGPDSLAYRHHDCKKNHITCCLGDHAQPVHAYVQSDSLVSESDLSCRKVCVTPK